MGLKAICYQRSDQYHGRFGRRPSMERATEIITKQRTTWGEIGYRFNWFFWGIILIILLAMIPVVGWFLGFGVFGTMLWKVFGFREKSLLARCPSCRSHFELQPKPVKTSCPYCHYPLLISGNQLLPDAEDD